MPLSRIASQDRVAAARMPVQSTAAAAATAPVSEETTERGTRTPSLPPTAPDTATKGTTAPTSGYRSREGTESSYPPTGGREDSGAEDDSDTTSDDDAVSLLSASTGSTERAFRAAKDALHKLREEAVAQQERKLEIPKGEEVHIAYPSEAGVVTTFCGTGLPGHKDGTVLDAMFNRPQGVAISPWTPRTVRYGVCGFTYVADTLNHCIRQIDRDGNVTTYAGDRKAGYADGSAPLARFNEPCGLVVNSDGDIFVADRMNNCIRMIEMKSKKVSTFVGTPRAGYAAPFPSSPRRVSLCAATASLRDTTVPHCCVQVL